MDEIVTIGPRQESFTAFNSALGEQVSRKQWRCWFLKKNTYIYIYFRKGMRREAWASTNESAKRELQQELKEEERMRRERDKEKWRRTRTDILLFSLSSPR